LEQRRIRFAASNVEQPVRGVPGARIVQISHHEHLQIRATSTLPTQS
jgi:hypothetical protein